MSSTINISWFQDWCVRRVSSDASSANNSAKSWYSSEILFIDVILIKFVCLVYKILTCSEFSQISLLSLLAKIVHISNVDLSISLLMCTNFSVEKLMIYCWKLIFRLMSLSYSNSSMTSCLSVNMMLNYISFIWDLIQSQVSSVL